MTPLEWFAVLQSAASLRTCFLDGYHMARVYQTAYRILATLFGRDRNIWLRKSIRHHYISKLTFY